MAWCSGCQDYRPVDEFNRHASSPNGYQAYCKCCGWIRRGTGRTAQDYARMIELRRNPPPQPLSKVCAGCNTDKPLEAFPKHLSGRYGRDTRCSQCRSELFAVKYRADPQKFRQRTETRRTRRRSQRVEKVCPTCGKTFSVPPSYSAAYTYCSMACRFHPPTREQSPYDLAYLAGIFDGEGCIIISPGPQHQIRMDVTNTHRGVIDWLRDTFGGRVQATKRGQYRRIYRWGASHRRAVALLKFLLPYLHVKKEQAELAIAYQEHRDTTLLTDGRNLKAGVPPDEYAIREGYRQRLSALKQAYGDYDTEDEEEGEADAA